MEPAPEPVVPPRLLQPRWEDGNFRFEVEGTPGQEVLIQVSEDGFQWMNLETRVLEDAPLVFSEPIRAGSAAVFFRVIVP